MRRPTSRAGVRSSTVTRSSPPVSSASMLSTEARSGARGGGARRRGGSGGPRRRRGRRGRCRTGAPRSRRSRRRRSRSRAPSRATTSLSGVPVMIRRRRSIRARPSVATSTNSRAAVARPRALDVAADVLGERAGELGVLERGDEQEAPVERDRAAEQALARLVVLEQALAQVAGADAGDLELDRVRSPGERGSKVSTDYWRKRRRIVSAMSCSSSSSARSTSKRRERSNVRPSPAAKAPSSRWEPRGRAPPYSMMRSTRCGEAEERLSAGGRGGR